jgi:hypothetical protein
MPERVLHIVAFDIPFPANYGGVIDVFYKLKALHKKGIKIILHCYEYPGRDRAEELKQFTEQIHYYPRLCGISSAISFKPYIVSSRRSDDLMANLLKDEHPILFEGMHSCYYINDKRLKNRFKIYRESNIEHRYYFNLFKVDKKKGKKLYYIIESLKLRIYQNVMKHANLMLVVSQEDTDYLKKHFPNNRVEYLPSYHANEEVEALPGKGEYALYHGNIEVGENAHAVSYLLKEVFNDLDYPLIIAGMNPPQRVIDLADQYPNAEVIANPDDDKMFSLISDAHVNIIVTFQATGLKLKLLNTLYKGRFCLVNDKMLNGTHLDPLCEIGNTPEELKKKLREIFKKEFKADQIQIREKTLKKFYSNAANANKLIELVWGA